MGLAKRKVFPSRLPIGSLAPLMVSLQHLGDPLHVGVIWRSPTDSKVCWGRNWLSLGQPERPGQKGREKGSVRKAGSRGLPIEQQQRSKLRFMALVNSWLRRRQIGVMGQRTTFKTTNQLSNNGHVLEVE